MKTSINKATIADLAYFGGEATFTRPLHVGTPNLGDHERYLGYVREILDSRWVTNNGSFVRELETQLEAMLGARHCVAVSSGTTGLMLLLRSLGLKGEVIVPSFTFVATVHAIRWLGLEPVFCDVDPLTHLIDPDQVQQLITQDTSAILGVHLWGQTCDVPNLETIARQHGLDLIFDAAHAFASSAYGQMVGSFGQAEVFSFHATKFFNTFEGGAITTDDSDLAHELRLQRNFGFADVDQVVGEGINGKLNELSAAMGLNLLPDLPAMRQNLRANYDLYVAGMGAFSGLHPLLYTTPEQNNCQYMVVEVDDSVFGRDLLYAILQAENILARRYFYPGCHRMEPYASLRPPGSWSLAVTERLTQRVLCLPNNASTTSDEIEQVLAVIDFVWAHQEEIQSAVAAMHG